MKLTAEQLKEIRTSDETQGQLAERFGVSQGTISNILNYRGAYTEVSSDLKLSTPVMSIEDVVEGYGAIELEDVELNSGEPETLNQAELLLLDQLVQQGSGMVECTEQNKHAGKSLNESDYVRRREDPKGHKWVLTDEGSLRHALEYYRLEYGLVEHKFQAEEIEETTRVGEVSKTRVRRDKVTQSNHIFSPEFEKRLGDQLERLVDHICGKK